MVPIPEIVRVEVTRPWTPPAKSGMGWGTSDEYATTSQTGVLVAVRVRVGVRVSVGVRVLVGVDVLV